MGLQGVLHQCKSGAESRAPHIAASEPVNPAARPGAID
jgi:hypothetical protein